MRPHHIIVIDCETLSEFPWNAVVVNLAATHHVIDMDQPIDLKHDIPDFHALVGDTFMAKLDVREQIIMGRSATDKCLDWWKTLPQSVQDQVNPSIMDVSPEGAINQYVEWLESKGVKKGAKNVSVWSRGQDFDPTLIRSLLYNVHGANDCDSVLPYQYARQRDIRTWIAAAFGDPERAWIPLKIPEFEHHNAIHDVARSMIEVIVCLGILQGNDVPDIVGE